jgi:hypothetical protein
MSTAKLEKVYSQSEDVVSREIEGELIIVPLIAGIGDMEDELYTLNETGQAIWRRLDGTMSLEIIINELAKEFDASLDVVENDCLGLIQELLKRKMIVELE